VSIRGSRFRWHTRGSIARGGRLFIRVKNFKKMRKSQFILLILDKQCLFRVHPSSIFAEMVVLVVVVLAYIVAC
jgi:hypothetical protein